MAGVQATPSDDNSEFEQVRIRGAGSLKNSNEPLFLVDGKEVDNIQEIRADDVESISVLKDEKATAVFGSSGANGVVSVKTKGSRKVELESNIVNNWGDAVSTIDKGFFNNNLKEVHIPSAQIKVVGMKDKKFHQALQFYSPKYTPTQVKLGGAGDNRKTLFWSPMIKTDKNGKASFSYHNSDESSTFRVVLEGIGNKGQVFRSESHTYYTQKALDFHAKMPKEATHGDTLMIPITVENHTDQILNGDIVVSQIYGIRILDFNNKINIPAGATKVTYLKALIENQHEGNAVCVISIDTELGKAMIKEEFKINAKGFPRIISMSSNSLQQSFVFEVNDILDNSVQGDIQFYPNIMEELVSGMESMLRQPHGCFEQTSSSNYPNVLALSYMQEQGQVDKAIQQKATHFIAAGYNRLKGFECSGGGFDWWGKGPANFNLSSHGLIQFHDMKKVYPEVDQRIIQRTIDYILDKRDGEGGYVNKSNRAGHGLGMSSYEVSNAYANYALTEAGYTNIENEITNSSAHAIKNNDAYLLALNAISNFNIKEKDRARQCLDLIKKQVLKDINTVTVNETITNSYSNNRIIEAMSLYAYAMMKDNDDMVDKAILAKVMEYLASNRSGYGGYGSTQATILALRAFTNYSKFLGKTSEGGKLQVYANGNKIYELEYTKGHRGRIIVDLKEHIQKGRNEITVAFDKTTKALPYSGKLTWTSLTPDTSPDCRVDLKTEIAKTNTKVGETVRLKATLENKISKNVHTPMAVIGIPAGLSLQPWQLKEMTEKGVFDYYEIHGNYLVAYFTGLLPKEKKEIKLDLKADIPGTYKAPASTAYLYYDDMDKVWNSGLTVQVSP